MITEVTFYTDGSTAPGNPGPSGYGFYGTDNLGNVYAGYGPVGILATNNMAELTATITALEKGLDIDSQPTINILTDSRYVTLGTESIDNYVKRNWRTSIGSEIKNVDLWKKLYNVITAYREQKRKLSFKWVKGHSGVVGNEKADKYADMGRLLNKQPDTDHYYSVTLRDENMTIEEVSAATVNVKSPKIRVKSSKAKIESLNPRLCGKKWYFRTNDSIMFEDRYCYVTTSYEMPIAKVEKRNKNLGKPNADTTISLLLSETPIVELDLLRDRFNAEYPNMQLPVVVDLNGLTKKSVWSEIKENGHLFTVIKKSIAVSPCNVHLGEVLLRPLLAFKFEQDVLRIGQLFKNYRAYSPQIVVKDITDLLLTANAKGVQKLSPNLIQGQKLVIVPESVLYNDTVSEIKLNIGIDTPTRNTFSSILKTAKSPISIELLLYEIDQYSFRVATVIKVDNDMILEIAPESSLKFIKR